eukprot:Blabericola_migrator_1__5486@NODE_27_length_20109_cov_273_259006_g24_i0_p5_GENE_NODE_27_length_20109_cov_273_259006_g24_i0NODE_27_length_20109_cov_273_259006_g24_i0_p5_ORF_typecomplete_len401_score76_07Factin_cap_A/PF01267_17/0_00012_NODE_27_length_20109_cov_273_259006_g24_i083539555
MTSRPSSKGNKPIPSLAFKAPNTITPSPRKTTGTTTRVSAKSHRTVVREFHIPRQVLVKPLDNNERIQTLCDWLLSFPPGRFHMWFFRIMTVLESVPSLQNLCDTFRTLSSATMGYTTTVLPVPKVKNQYPHWGTFGARPETVPYPALARVMVMDGARIKPDNESLEDPGDEYLWVIVMNSQMDLVLVNPGERTAIECKSPDEALVKSVDMQLLKAGMTMGFVGQLEQALRDYSVKRYPCPNSAINVVVRKGVNNEPDSIQIDIGIGSDSAEEWGGQLSSEWRISLKSESAQDALCKGEIASDVQSLLYGCFRMKQNRKLAAFHVSDINLFDPPAFSRRVVSIIQSYEDEVQLGLQQWLCGWHESLWYHVRRDDYGVKGSVILGRQDFCRELEAAIHENL